MPDPGRSGREVLLNSTLERELILKCQAGDSRFYEPIVRAYEPSAIRVAAGMLGNRQDAKEAVQDAFVKAYEAIDRFDPGRPFQPWFFRILRNHCRDVLRSRKARFSTEILDERLSQRPAGAEASPERVRKRNAAREAIWSALERISEDHREVIVLKDLQGYRYAEIAEMLEIPEGTVASRLYHARDALRQELEAMGVDYP